jgi:hypothetical protein
VLQATQLLGEPKAVRPDHAAADGGHGTLVLPSQHHTQGTITAPYTQGDFESHAL